jgi:hypothetical protein
MTAKRLATTRRLPSAAGLLTLLAACLGTAGCAHEDQFVKRMRQHDARLQIDRVAYEVELQEARRNHDEQASLR